MPRNYTSTGIARLWVAIISLSIGLLTISASAESVLDPNAISVPVVGSEWWSLEA